MELTTIDAIIKIVNEVGFPIFAFLCVCAALVYTTRLHKEEIGGLKEVIESLKSAIEEQTVILKASQMANGMSDKED